MTEQAAPAQVPAEGMGPAPKAPAKAGGVRRVLVPIVVGLVVVLGGIAWKYASGDPAVAKVGDCMIESADANKMKTVDCTDAKAANKVVGKIEGKTKADFNASDNPCTAYQTAESALWGAKKGTKGYILCLEPIKK